MKVSGAMLIVISSLICALRYSKLKTKRIRELKSVCSALELMIKEITAKLTPLPELAEIMCCKLSGSALDFAQVLSANLSELGVKEFRIIWHNTIENCFSELRSEEISELNGLGMVLGRYDGEVQVCSINNCLSYFMEKHRAEETELPQKKRLSLGLSLSSALLIVIALI